MPTCNFGSSSGGGGGAAKRSGATASKPEESKVILSSTVKAERRYDEMKEQFADDRKYQAENLLRKVMEMERDGKTSGTYTVHDFMGTRKLYGGGYTDFGKVINEHVKALKVAGYKVTSREASDLHSYGYRSARGGRVYASTSRSRILHFEKVKK